MLNRNEAFIEDSSLKISLRPWAFGFCFSPSFDRLKFCKISASRIFFNDLRTIPNRVAAITVLLEDQNHDDHDGPTNPPFVSDRSKIQTSAMSALKNGKEALMVYETIRLTRRIKFGSDRATVREFD